MSLPPSPPHRICLNREGKRPRFGQVSIEEHLNPKKVSLSLSLCHVNSAVSTFFYPEPTTSFPSFLSSPTPNIPYFGISASAPLFIYSLFPHHSPSITGAESQLPAPPQNSTFWHLQARLSCSFSAPQLLVVLQSPRQRSWDGWSEAGRAEGKGCCFLQLSTSGQFKTKTFGVREGNGESGSAPCDQLESIGTALLGVDVNPEGSNSTRFVTLVHCWCFWRSLAHRDAFPTSPEQESSFPTFPRH